MTEEHNQTPEQGSSQDSDARMRSIRDTWLQAWGVQEVFHTLGEPSLTEQDYLDGRHRLLHQIAAGLDIPEATRAMMRQPLLEKIGAYGQEHTLALSTAEQEQLLESLLDDLLGLSLLEPLMADADVSDIMVNAPQDIWIIQRRKLVRLNRTFEQSGHLLRVIRQLCTAQGFWLDQASPMGQLRLPNATVSLTLPPVAIDAPTLTIHKFSSDQITLENLQQFRSISQEIADFMMACMRTNLNVMVAGGMSSGKTSVLNILTTYIPDAKRIVKIEEVASIQVRRVQHTVSLEGRPPDAHGRGGITVKDLLVQAKTMMPGRIIVGELQGPEVLDVVRLMERGYPILTLMHAENPGHAMERLEMLVKFHHPDLPTPHLRAFLGSTVDLIIQANRLPDGSRKITAIAEVQSLRTSDYTIHPIFTFQQTGTDDRGKILGEFRSNLMSERLEQQFRAAGIFLPGVMRTEEQHEH